MVITRGDTLKLKIKYLDKSKNPIELSGDSFIRFTVKDLIDGDKIFQKTITVENYDQTEQCYLVTINPEDTQDEDMQGQEKITYLYDFELTDIITEINEQTGEEEEVERIVKTLDKGKFIIKYDITTT